MAPEAPAPGGSFQRRGRARGGRAAASDSIDSSGATRTGRGMGTAPLPALLSDASPPPPPPGRRRLCRPRALREPCGEKHLAALRAPLLQAGATSLTRIPNQQSRTKECGCFTCVRRIGTFSSRTPRRWPSELDERRPGRRIRPLATPAKLHDVPDWPHRAPGSKRPSCPPVFLLRTRERAVCLRLLRWLWEGRLRAHRTSRTLRISSHKANERRIIIRPVPNTRYKHKARRPLANLLPSIGWLSSANYTNNGASSHCSRQVHSRGSD
ncbi:Protein of unknown function [Gryllus bimaculatus]|nr:Protein of unknown function [Gryllus bimaculatus]